MYHDYLHYLVSIGFSDGDALEIAEAHANFLDEDFPEEDLNRRWGGDLMMWLHESYLKTYRKV